MDILIDSIEFNKSKFTFDSTMVCMTHKFRYYDEEEKRHMIVPITLYFDKDVTIIKGMSGYEYGDHGSKIYMGALF